MTDKYIGKPVLKHCYCEHEYKKKQKAKRCIIKVPKVKKNVFKARIERSLQLKGVQNTTGVYPRFSN